MMMIIIIIVSLVDFVSYETGKVLVHRKAAAVLPVRESDKVEYRCSRESK
jgi:hypothetical protein